MKDDDEPRTSGEQIEGTLPGRTRETLAEAEATVARCEREHDRWSGRMYWASRGMLACFSTIVVLALLGVRPLVLSLPALAGVVLWAVESAVFREAVEWMFWRDKARRELQSHPDFRGTWRVEGERDKP